MVQVLLPDPRLRPVHKRKQLLSPQVRTGLFGQSMTPFLLLLIKEVSSDIHKVELLCLYLAGVVVCCLFHLLHLPLL